ELANLAVPSAPHVVALGKPPQEAGAWVVRLDVCFGLVRAKAWRQGDPEPPNWQSTRYRGTPLWQPTLIGIGTDTPGTVHLGSLSVRGSALPPVPPPEQRQKVEQAGKLAREGMAFFRQGQFEQALARQRQALALYRDGFPPEHPARPPALAASLEGVASKLAS